MLRYLMSLGSLTSPVIQANVKYDRQRHLRRLTDPFFMSARDPPTRSNSAEFQGLG